MLTHARGTPAIAAVLVGWINRTAGSHPSGSLQLHWELWVFNTPEMWPLY